jgi:hypothetical protein
LLLLHAKLGVDDGRQRDAVGEHPRGRRCDLGPVFVQEQLRLPLEFVVLSEQLVGAQVDVVRVLPRKRLPTVRVVADEAAQKHLVFDRARQEVHGLHERQRRV